MHFISRANRLNSGWEFFEFLLEIGFSLTIVIAEIKSWINICLKRHQRSELHFIWYDQQGQARILQKIRLKLAHLICRMFASKFDSNQNGRT